LKHQTTGEIDDAKLIDGVTGERLIYKKRGEATPLAGMPPPEPRRLHFVLDVSGSMYRFNSQDGRLNRVLETAVLIMEGFRGFENKCVAVVAWCVGAAPPRGGAAFGLVHRDEVLPPPPRSPCCVCVWRVHARLLFWVCVCGRRCRFDYRIVGHSGDTASIGFVDLGAPPQNQRVRLGVVEKMVAHSQVRPRDVATSGGVVIHVYWSPLSLTVVNPRMCCPHVVCGSSVGVVTTRLRRRDKLFRKRRQ